MVNALTNAQEIATRCGPALPDGEPIWPDLNLPQGQSPDEALAALARSGLEARLRHRAVARSRASASQTELAAIARHGYAPLFLVVADIVRFARETVFPVNTRGSVANSLVAYCTGITTVDPIAHDLLFERFLNPARADLPDIDLDFCSRRRDEVLDYVRRTYGADHVALVATVSTLQPRVGRARDGQGLRAGRGADQAADGPPAPALAPRSAAAGPAHGRGRAGRVGGSSPARGHPRGLQHSSASPTT